MLQRCVSSMDADEKIIVVNEGTGMGKAINLGARLATGDYFVISNNDCVLGDGSLQQLCIPWTITYVEGIQIGSFYCVPRKVWEQVGGYDENYEVSYFDDDDMVMRWKQAKIPRVSVNLVMDHPGGTTLDDMPRKDEIFNRNREYYEKKWAKDL